MTGLLALNQYLSYTHSPNAPGDLHSRKSERHCGSTRTLVLVSGGSGCRCRSYHPTAPLVNLLRAYTVVQEDFTKNLQRWIDFYLQSKPPAPVDRRFNFIRDSVEQACIRWIADVFLAVLHGGIWAMRSRIFESIHALPCHGSPVRRCAVWGRKLSISFLLLGCALPATPAPKTRFPMGRASSSTFPFPRRKSSRWCRMSCRMASSEEPKSTTKISSWRAPSPTHPRKFFPEWTEGGRSSTRSACTPSTR